VGDLTIKNVPAGQLFCRNFSMPTYYAAISLIRRQRETGTLIVSAYHDELARQLRRKFYSEQNAAARGCAMLVIVNQSELNSNRKKSGNDCQSLTPQLGEVCRKIILFLLNIDLPDK
jgi:hypothetical protein